MEALEDKKLRLSSTGTLFFMNNQLHRLIRKSYANNICYAFSYETNKVEKYTYKDYKKFKKKAYLISEVSRILRRHPDRIRVAFYEGGVKRPFLLEYKGRTPVYYFSEDDIYRLRDYFATVHRGRPRSDGLITSRDVPSVGEIDAILGKRTALYVRTPEGEFIPVWRQEDFE